MMPRLVFSDKKGNINVHPHLSMLGALGQNFVRPVHRELIVLPKGSTLFYLPGHIPVGFDEEHQCEAILEEFSGKKIYPVSAFTIPGYTRLLLPAALKNDPAVKLSLWSYTAVGWARGKFWIAAVKIDNRTRQRPHYYENRLLLEKKTQEFVRRFPDNRLVKHLVRCGLAYNCRAAQNLFFGRWEAPLPASPSCNARCLGCLSFQESDCSASHERIRFVPSPEEIAAIAVYHLTRAKQAIVSFGQGCEGEPLLQFKTLHAAIKLIRSRTSRGTIHLNTNAYHPQHVRELAEIGLDSIRVSINSFQENCYAAYYRPLRYRLQDVLKATEYAKKSRLFVSLNLLVFPGFTDTPTEVKRLINFFKKGYVDFVQMRNLCIDPELYWKTIPAQRERGMGILAMIAQIRRAIPRIRFGYFNVPRERFCTRLS